MKRRWRAASCTLCALAILNAAPVPAQGPGDSLRVSLLTMGPGRELFERFGHNAIRIRDLRSGMDSAYNWGVFDFNQERFIWRFLTGDTKYQMQGYPSVPLVTLYRSNGRAVWEQDLALTAPERDSLWRYIQWNAREENKYYRYDYYRDNCSTRVRDAIDLALGGSLRRATDLRAHGVSYRSETLRLGAEFPLINFGMDFALGSRADSTLTAWDEMFIPMRLQDYLRGVHLEHADGAAGPLVSGERQLVVDDRFTERSAPPGFFAPALAAGIALSAVLALLAALAGSSRGARAALAVAGASWSVLAGLVGPFVLALGLWTKHAYMTQNANLLVATPASLLLAVFFPLALMRGRHVRAALGLALLVVALALFALTLKLVPSLGQQQNGAIIALAIPVHAVLAAALWRLAGPRAGAAV